MPYVEEEVSATLVGNIVAGDESSFYTDWASARAAATGDEIDPVDNQVPAGNISISGREWPGGMFSIYRALLTSQCGLRLGAYHLPLSKGVSASSNRHCNRSLLYPWQLLGPLGLQSGRGCELVLHRCPLRGPGGHQC
jgi:hypothetical protein